MVHRDTVDPARGDPCSDLSSLPIADPRLIRPVLLRHLDSNADPWMASVMPGRPGHAGEFERLPL